MICRRHRAWFSGSAFAKNFASEPQPQTARSEARDDTPQSFRCYVIGVWSQEMDAEILQVAGRRCGRWITEKHVGCMHQRSGPLPMHRPLPFWLHAQRSLGNCSAAAHFAWFKFSVALRPQRPQGLLETWSPDGDVHFHTVQWCFTSTATAGLGDGEPRAATSSSHSSWCCFTSTETVGTVRDGEPRRATSNFTQFSVALRPETIETVRDGEPSGRTATSTFTQFSVALRPQRP